LRHYALAVSHGRQEMSSTPADHPGVLRHEVLALS